VCRILGRGLYPVWNWYVELVLPAFSNEASHATREAEEQGGGGADKVHMDMRSRMGMRAVGSAYRAAAAAEGATAAGARAAAEHRSVGEDQLLRYRMVLGSCILPCVIGFVLLLCACLGRCGRAAKGHDPLCGPSSRSTAADDDASALRMAPVLSVPPPAQRDRKQDAAPRHNHNSSVAVWVLGAALLAQGATSALLWTLWPLWLRLHFRTGDIGFAPLLFLTSVAAIAALAAAPAWRAKIGSARRTAALSCFATGVLAPLAFAMQCSGGFTAHVALLLGCVLSLTMLEASLKVYVSEIAPRSWQGSALGVAASCVGVGALLANIVGTLLYEASIPTGIGAEDNLRTWPPILDPRSSTCLY
jgi:MFS family permease